MQTEGGLLFRGPCITENTSVSVKFMVYKYYEKKNLLESVYCGVSLLMATWYTYTVPKEQTDNQHLQHKSITI
jgi:hypothetical protein